MADKTQNELIFNKQNYRLLLIALAVLVVGYLLMSGPGNQDPNEFNADIFSFRRITLAPIVVLSGYALVIVAILKRPKQNHAER